ncbi:hypothetical protein [Thiorhodovibrio frisius]|uniref:Uncharacterized protein n=1 Tax=Thiorhodovibrio frisius TaxID=631362 RepID=H8YX98_9GAMM|nr:hypothetical protein [Thiorhodovibrio frisius]EIC23074.1 hypothetical protein Thi970DRAFT_00725 [Thiorhodovibrio frisius]WPL22661.1 hypothetical protein Thiofri_02831 [Thiorhodovibrio frisius]
MQIGNRFLFQLVLALIGLIFSTYSFAAANFEIKSSNNAEATEQSTVDIVSDGLGLTQEKALNNAITNAIQQVVGQFVQAETILANDGIIKDEVVEYSAGYLERYNIIKQYQDEDGLYHVKIMGAVQQTRLLEKLNDLNIATHDVDGRSLATKAQTLQDTTEQAASVLASVLSKYPQAAFEIQIDNVDVPEKPNAEGKATLLIDATIGFDEQFLKHLDNALNQVSLKAQDAVQFDRFLAMHEKYEQGIATWCLTDYPSFRIPKSPHENHLSIVDRCYVLPDSVFFKALEKADMAKKDDYSKMLVYFDNSQAAKGWTNRYGNPGESVLIEVLDKDEKVIFRHITVLSQPGQGSLLWGPMDYLWKDLGWAYAKDSSWEAGRSQWKLLFFANSKTSIQIPFELDSTELSNVSSVKMSVRDFR